MRVKKDKKQRKAPSFGVLDAVIILLVIVSVVGIYFRYNILGFISEARDIKSYTVSYSIKDIRYTTPNFINVGDKVYFNDSGDDFGELIAASENMGALSIAPASEYFTASTGEIVKVMYPDSQSRVDANGRLICDGRYSNEGGFLVNGSTHIAAGQTVAIRTEHVTLSIFIEDIELTEEN